MQMILDAVLPHLTNVLMLALVAVFGMAVRELRKISKIPLLLAQKFAEQAGKTPGKGDDAAAAVAVAAAQVLAVAFDKAIADKK